MIYGANVSYTYKGKREQPKPVAEVVTEVLVEAKPEEPTMVNPKPTWKARRQRKKSDLPYGLKEVGSTE